MFPRLRRPIRMTSVSLRGLPSGQVVRSSSSEHALEVAVKTDELRGSSHVRMPSDTEKPENHAATQSPASPPPRTPPEMEGAATHPSDEETQLSFKQSVRRTASDTVVTDQPKRLPQVYVKQKEFDLASVLFAPPNVAALNRKKKHRKRLPDRSQSSHEIGASPRGGCESLKTDAKPRPKKSVTFKEDIAQVRETDDIWKSDTLPAVVNDEKIDTSLPDMRLTRNHEMRDTEGYTDAKGQRAESAPSDSDDDIGLIIDENARCADHGVSNEQLIGTLKPAEASATISEDAEPKGCVLAINDDRDTQSTTSKPLQDYRTFQQSKAPNDCLQEKNIKEQQIDCHITGKSPLNLPNNHTTSDDQAGQKCISRTPDQIPSVRGCPCEVSSQSAIYNNDHASSNLSPSERNVLLSLSTSASKEMGCGAATQVPVAKTHDGSSDSGQRVAATGSWKPTCRIAASLNTCTTSSFQSHKKPPAACCLSPAVRPVPVSANAKTSVNTTRLLSPSYFQSRTVSGKQGFQRNNFSQLVSPVSSQFTSSHIPVPTTSVQTSGNKTSMVGIPQILFIPDNIRASLPRLGALRPTSAATLTQSGPRLSSAQAELWRAHKPTPTAVLVQCPPVFPSYQQASPGCYFGPNIVQNTGHQNRIQGWQDSSQAVRILQPLVVASSSYQPVRYAVVGDTVAATSASRPLPPAVPLAMPTRAPPKVPSVFPVPQSATLAPPRQRLHLQVIQEPQLLQEPPPPPPPTPRNLSSPLPPPPPPPPPTTPKPSPHLVPKTNTPVATTSPQEQTPSNKSQTRVTPSSLIPNGTLFVQTPRGLVQLPKQVQIKRTTSVGSSLQQQKITNSAEDKTSAHGNQNRGIHSLRSLTEDQSQPPLSKVLTVRMKPGETTGIRLPFQRLSQKQLQLYPSSKNASLSPNKAPQETSAHKVFSSSVKSTESKLGQNSREENRENGKDESKASEESDEVRASQGLEINDSNYTDSMTPACYGGDDIGGTRISENVTTSRGISKEIAGKPGTGEIICNDKSLSQACSQTENSVRSIHNKDSKLQANITTGQWSKSRYVKFLDSSVTVNCMYVPKAPPSIPVEENTAKAKTMSPSNSGEEPNKISPSKTVPSNDEDSDSVPSDKDIEDEDARSEPVSVRSSTDETHSDETTSSPTENYDKASREVANRKPFTRGCMTHEKDSKTLSDEDNEIEWRPSVPLKAASRHTRRFRNPLTGGLSKINIWTAARRSSGEKSATRKERRVQNVKKDDCGETSATKGSKRGPKTKTVGSGAKCKGEILNDGKRLLASVTATDVSNGRAYMTVDGEESSLSSRPSSALSSTEDDATLLDITSAPEGQFGTSAQNIEKSQNDNTLDEFFDQPYDTKEPSGSRSGSPYKRHHLRSRQSLSSDSDNRLSKCPKRVSFDDSDTSTTSADAVRKEVLFRQARGTPRKAPDGWKYSHHAPLWQKVLKMLGLKKRKPVLSSPNGGQNWHKRRSSSVVLAESLAESAKRLEREKEAANQTENKEATNTAKKGISVDQKCLSSKKDNHSKDRDSAGTRGPKKGATKAKKQRKRRKLVKKAKVSPQSTTDPTSDSLTSIDFDSRRQTRSRTRRQQDSDSISSSQAETSSPSCARRGRRTLASISAQAWEDCYRSTYLKWKETNMKPESLTIDEGFKVMTSELGTPRTGPSQDKKSFQKLLISKWEDIVQSAQTGSLGEESETETQKQTSAVDHNTGALTLIDTPPVAAEFSVYTVDHDDFSAQEVETDYPWQSQGMVDTEDDGRSGIDTAHKEDITDKHGAAVYNNLSLPISDTKYEEDTKKDFYGYPPALSPIQDLSEEYLDRSDKQQEMLEIPDAAKATGFIIPEALTEETLRLLAESGSIDADLTGVQAFALFMTGVGDAAPYGDPDSSPPPQPVSNDDDDVPPVISCHRLDNCGVNDDITNEEEDGEIDVDGPHKDDMNQSRDLLFISSPSADDSHQGGFAYEEEKLPDAIHAQKRELEQAAFKTTFTSEASPDDSLATAMMSRDDNHHSNEADDTLDCQNLQTMDSSNASLEEGEIISDGPDGLSVTEATDK